MMRLGIPVLYMKKCLLCALVLLLPTEIRAQDSVRIDHVGLGTAELFTSNLPTPVQVHIPALPRAQKLGLQFQFETSDSDKVPLTLEPHTVSKQMQVLAGMPMDIEAAVPLPPSTLLTLKVVVLDEAGHEVGEARRGLNTRGLAGRNLAIIYCREKKTCDEAWSQVHSSADAEERVSKTRTRVIETLRQPLQHWWEYAIADAVVISAETSQLTADERDAFEKYVRHGGTLILLEKDSGDASFLGDYRKEALAPAPIPVGRGKLIRLPSLESNSLGSGIKWGVAPDNVGEYTKWFAKALGDQDFFLDRIGISFTFPRLRWLIIWLSVFIFTVGPINFILLRRMGKLEWGWRTTCAISMLFAGGLYLANSARRPKDFMLDDTAVYWMDSLSPQAVAQYGFRVYTPERGPVTLSFAQNAMLPDANWYQTFSDSGTEIGVGMTGKKATLTGWQMELGPPAQIQFPMYRWSFQDFHAEGYRAFSGTVHWTSPMHLKNDTGQTFHQALYLDFKINQQFLIPEVAPGQEVDLSAVRPSPIYTSEEQRSSEQMVQQLIEQRRQAMAIKPFSVEEVPYSNLSFVKQGQAFVGWIDSQTRNARLDVPFVNRPGGALVIVTFEKQ